MSFRVRVEVWGDYALFSRPEMKVERVTYDVMTPSAARGILEAIFWHPGLKIVVDRIFVLNKIKFVNIRRNEVKNKISAESVRRVMTKKEGRLYLATSQNIVQRAAMVLKNVRYVIEAHFGFVQCNARHIKDNICKFYNIFMQRLERGQCYHTPCFGTREFPANFRPYKLDTITTAYPNEERDLGFMLYDMDFSDKNNIQPIFFRAVLRNGVLDVSKFNAHGLEAYR